MNRLENLPELTARRLGGLNADARLLGKIRIAAAEQPARRRVAWRPILAGGVAVALCLCIGLWGTTTVWGHHTAIDEATRALRGSHAAGGVEEVAVTQTPSTGENVPVGSISIGSASTEANAYRNVFSPERSGNFPVILANGAAYRMLISPTEMKTELLGAALGTVTEYTLEPALSTGGFVSNIVSADGTVFAVKGMEGAMVAAYVKGSLRVFQRISFAGVAILGNETLQSTLTDASHVTAMELTGAGVITDPAVCQRLMQTLLDNAEYESASVASGDTRSLQIGLDNGLLMQLMVGDDTVSACGTWSCPEFFEAYDEAVQAE